MRKTAKTNPEFDNFTAFMDKLAKVPNSEVKAALEEEKFEKWVKRTAKDFGRKDGNQGAIFLKERGQNPLVDVANEVFRRADRRKLN